MTRQPPAKALRAKPLLAHLLATALALGLLSHPGTAQAKRSKGHTSAAQAPHKKGVRKVTYQRSTSEETPAQRDSRLRRECKGMHNAGACMGYTR